MERNVLEERLEERSGLVRERLVKVKDSKRTPSRRLVIKDEINLHLFITSPDLIEIHRLLFQLGL